MNFHPLTLAIWNVIGHWPAERIWGYGPRPTLH